MYFIQLTGTPREIGEQHGREFKNEIHKCYDFFCVQNKITPDKLDKTVLDYLKMHFTYLLEEIEGIAKGAGMKFEEVLTYNHFPAIPVCTPVFWCTPVFFKNTEVGPILAQNLDTVPEEGKAELVRIVRPKKGHAFIASNLVGTVWAGNAINDVGVAKASVSSHHKEYKFTSGASENLIFRHIIQSAGNVDEAFEIAKSHTYIGKIGIHIIADHSGKAIKYETNNKKHFALSVKNGFGFSTGLYESEIEAQDEPELLQMKEDRKRTIEELYNKGKIEFSLEGMKKLLSYHHSPGSICRHRPWQKTGSNTQSSRIMIINQRKFLVTDGPPCTHKYKEYKL